MMLTFIPLFLLTFLRVHCKCEGGFYLKNGTCNKCPDTCSACQTDDFCTECKNGYYDLSCSSRCNPHCRNDACSIRSKFCLSCEDGYFFDTNINCVSCPPGCSVCSDDIECSACEVGFKGKKCKEPCVNCKTGTGCDKETGECLTCEDGFSGLLCNINCSLNCITCQRLNKSYCTSCASSRHGANCDFVCPKNCADTVCFDGSCQGGCLKGYWGMKCENRCSADCLGQVCERYSGVCIHIYKCPANFTDNNCICDKDGRCVYCIEESDVDCGPQCSEGCKGQYCYRDTRNCLDGCKDSYRGLRCESHKLEFKEIWLTGLLAVPVAVIACVIICRLWRRRQTQNQQSSMQQASDYTEITDLQQRAYTELNDELREHPSSSTYTPLGLTDENEKVTDKTADGHDSAYLTPVSSPKQESVLELSANM